MISCNLHIYFQRAYCDTYHTHTYIRTHIHTGKVICVGRFARFKKKYDAALDVSDSLYRTMYLESKLSAKKKSKI